MVSMQGEDVVFFLLLSGWGLTYVQNDMVPGVLRGCQCVQLACLSAAKCVGVKSAMFDV